MVANSRVVAAKSSGYLNLYFWFLAAFIRISNDGQRAKGSSDQRTIYLTSGQLPHLHENARQENIGKMLSMNAITRTPRLLVKLPAAPQQVGFKFGNKPLNIGFQRLFESIRPSAASLGATSVPEWHAMSATEAAGEVNMWDLCHHVVTQGFGVAGLATAEFAEPDMSQQWITATPVEHALAAARTCDKPTDSDPRLPTGSGFFWFRDSSHSQLEAARSAVGEPADRVCIAHLDTGYDPHHESKPLFLLTKTPNNLQKNFVDANRSRRRCRSYFRYFHKSRAWNRHLGHPGRSQGGWRPTWGCAFC